MCIENQPAVSASVSAFLTCRARRHVKAARKKYNRDLENHRKAKGEMKEKKIKGLQDELSDVEEKK